LIKKKIFYEDSFLKEILANTSTIAMVGLSDKENRPSFFAAKYLQNKGYKIIPVNPITKKKKILGEKVYKCLDDLNENPDMIDLFVNQNNIKNFVKDAFSISTKTIWLQLGLFDLEGEKRAKKKGINFIMNRCPKIEFARLSGELGWAGINSNVISNKKIVLKK